MRVGIAPLMVAIGLFGVAAPAGAQAPLRDQRVEGVRRVCIYGPPNVRYDAQNRASSAVNRDPADRLRTLRIGRGEPCPRTYRAPTEPAQQIPTMATLVGQQRQALGIRCTYRYHGRDYQRLIPVSQRCPYTPVFFGEPVTGPAGGNPSPGRN